MTALDRYSVGPYLGVSRDAVLRFANGESYRVIVYAAYNACGLIGSESNGIAVLDENRLCVVADQIEKQISGYYGPSREQTERFKQILQMSWEEFRELVNGSGRNRYVL